MIKYPLLNIDPQGYAHMEFVGITIKNFRSIGLDGIEIYPVRKCNILIGQNNVGKSNALRAIQRILNHLNPFPGLEGAKQLEFIDYHKQDQSCIPRITLHFILDKVNDKNLFDVYGKDSIFFDFTWGSNFQITEYSFSQITDFNRANALLEFTIKHRWSSRVPAEQIRNEFLKFADPIFSAYCKEHIPHVVFIPEFRRIEANSSYLFHGSGIPDQLAKWQHPSIERSKDRDKFDKVQYFVRKLLHMPFAELEVDTSNSLILNNGVTRLPLASYGTGIHQITIFLVAVLHAENTLFCVEEPEIHLHPALQRELIQFLLAETSHQYMFSSHSHAFINIASAMPSHLAKDIQIFHLQLLEDATVGRPIKAQVETLNLISDLGVRASDLLQSNVVIWVEGPSDRIYINAWFAFISPELIEGLHYSIMFYGGRLLSHLSASRDDNHQELIELLKINQHSIIVIDSDKTSKTATINPTKARIEVECGKSETLCWITDGREIENYIPSQLISRMYQSECNMPLTFKYGTFDKLEKVIESATSKEGKPKLDYASDKPYYARQIVEMMTKDDIGDDLTKRLQLLTSKIKEWNK